MHQSSPLKTPLITLCRRPGMFLFILVCASLAVADIARRTKAATIVRVTVAQSPTINITSPQNNNKFELGQPIPVEVKLEDSDDTVKVEFFADTFKIGEVTTTPLRFKWSPTATGTYSLTAKITTRITNTRNVTALSSPVTVNIFSKPTIRFIEPKITLERTPVIRPSTPFLLKVAASDADGSISRVVFKDNGQILGEANKTKSHWVFSWAAPTLGKHTIEAKAIDDTGNKQIAELDVMVSIPPVVKAAYSEASPSSEPPMPARITATVTDGDPVGGEVARVEFFAEGMDTAMETDNAYPYEMNAPTKPGNYRLRVVATDALGVTGEDRVEFAVVSAAEENAAKHNGIFVGQTKIFDERSLALMLNATQARLANTDFFDQKSIADAIGKFQGARSDSSALGVNVTTTPLPGITSSISDGLKTTVTDTLTQASAAAGAAPPTPATESTTVTETTDGSKVDVTRPSVTPAPPALPGQSSAFAYQPNFNLAPQNLLAQQMATNFEIANLRLLLENAVSDRITDVDVEEGDASGTVLAARTRVVVGFLITLDSLDVYRNAVAEVEVTMRPLKQNKRRLSLVSLMPKEGIYNVATVTKNAKQFGLGVAVQPISFGLNMQRQSETLFLIQDLDTISFERAHPSRQGAHTDSGAITFGWQFRPVLGQKAVRAGTRQVYAVLALPNGAAADFVGDIEVHTHWRHYDQKKKLVGELIPNSESYQRLDNLKVNAKALSGESLTPRSDDAEWMDAGAGNVLVTVKGQYFLPGTSVGIGDKILSSAADGLFIQSEDHLRFYVPAQRLALLPEPLIISRFGAPVRLKESLVDSEMSKNSSSYGLKILKVAVAPVSAQNSRVTVTLTSRNNGMPLMSHYSGMEKKRFQPVVIIGTQHFGFLDSPITLSESSERTLDLSFTAPTQAIRDAGKIVVRKLFWGDDYRDEMAFSDAGFSMPPVFTAAEVTILSSDKEQALLAIRGSNFTPAVAVVAGDGAPIKADGSTTPPFLTRNSPTLLTLGLPAARFKNLQRVIISQSDAQPVILPVSVPPQPLPKPVINPLTAVSINDEDNLRVEGTNLQHVERVLFGDAVLKVVEVDTAGGWLVVRLMKEVTGTAGSKGLEFVTKDNQIVHKTIEVRSR